MSPVSKPVTRSLKVKVTVAVSPAVRWLSLIVTVTSGGLSTTVGLVSMLKLPLLALPVPALPCASSTPAKFTRVGAACSGVAWGVKDAGQVEGDGVGGAFGVGPGRVGGCPDPAVGAHRRQSAQRAFAGVVLDVLGAKA